MDNEAILNKFYTSFQQKDPEGMTDCYAEDVVFEDPVFGKLTDDEVNWMWKMLIEFGADLTISFSSVKVEGDKGSANWEAIYTFSKTGRKVHNNIQADFEFSNGKIVKHTDNFDLKLWSRQAFGWMGYLLGGTKYFQNKLRTQVKQSLIKYKAKKNGK